MTSYRILNQFDIQSTTSCQRKVWRGKRGIETLNACIKWARIRFNDVVEVEKWRQIDGRFRRCDCTDCMPTSWLWCVLMTFSLLSSTLQKWRLNTCQGVIWLWYDRILDFIMLYLTASVSFMLILFNDKRPPPISINGEYWRRLWICARVKHTVALTLSINLMLLHKKVIEFFFAQNLSAFIILPSIRMLYRRE